MTTQQITEAIIKKATEQIGTFDCMTVTNLLGEDGLKVDHHDVAMELDNLRAAGILMKVASSDATKYAVVIS